MSRKRNLNLHMTAIPQRCNLLLQQRNLATDTEFAPRPLRACLVAPQTHQSSSNRATFCSISAPGRYKMHTTRAKRLPIALQNAVHSTVHAKHRNTRRDIKYTRLLISGISFIITITESIFCLCNSHSFNTSNHIRSIQLINT